MRFTVALRACLFVFLFQAAAFARAPAHPQSETYGTSSLTWLTLTSWDFHPADSLTTYGVTNNPTYGIYNNTSGGSYQFNAGLHLPDGAIVSAIELSACDTHGTQDLSAAFLAYLKTGASTNAPGLVSTSGSSGCQVVLSNTFSPWTVNNDTTYYLVNVNFGFAIDARLVLNSVRVGYKLQVSPPPAAATFSDVPTTHLFFQYVEALAAAGITSGCGGGNFCPDAAVTRGQMTVFLV